MTAPDHVCPCLHCRGIPRRAPGTRATSDAFTLGARLVTNSRESADPYLWDLIDAIDGVPLDPAKAEAHAAYLSALADGIGVALGKRPPAVTLPGADA